MEAFRRICRDAFGIGEESLRRRRRISQRFRLRDQRRPGDRDVPGLDLERRKLLARHMAEIAKADSQLAENEVRLLRRTLELLGISPVDLVKPAGGPS